MADTLTITVAGSAKVLTRINNDNYANEYYLRETAGDFRLRTKHSDDKVGTGSVPRKRHVVSFEARTFPTATAPELVRLTTFTIVSSAYDDPVEQVKPALGLFAFATSAQLTALIGYQI